MLFQSGEFEPRVNPTPFQHIVSRQSFIVEVHHHCIAPPTCKAYRIAILLHNYCAIYAPPPPPPPVDAMHHTILVMAISCKGHRVSIEPKGQPGLTLMIVIIIPTILVGHNHEPGALFSYRSLSQIKSERGGEEEDSL